MRQDVSIVKYSFTTSYINNNSSIEIIDSDIDRLFKAHF